VAQVVARDEADARALGDESAVDDLVVGAQGEVGASQRQAHPGRAANDRVVAVVADQAMATQVVAVAQRRRAGEVALVRRGDDLDLAELLRDQRRLRRPHHPQRDVGLAPQQVGELVRRHQLDLDLGMGTLQRGEHRRQQPGRSDLAGRDADDSLRRRARRGQATGDGERSVPHPPRRLGDRERGTGRCDAATGALEEGHAELRLELGDVRLKVGCCAPLRFAAAVTLPASRTARKLRTRVQSKRARASESMRKCMTCMQIRI
jgi:hypothetical protein